MFIMGYPCTLTPCPQFCVQNTPQPPPSFPARRPSAPLHYPPSAASSTRAQPPWLHVLGDGREQSVSNPQALTVSETTLVNVGDCRRLDCCRRYFLSSPLLAVVPLCRCVCCRKYEAAMMRSLALGMVKPGGGARTKKSFYLQIFQPRTPTITSTVGAVKQWFVASEQCCCCAGLDSFPALSLAG